VQINFGDRNQPPAREPVRIPIPGLHGMVGLGQVIAAMTQKVGIQPCGGCKKRQEALDRAVLFQGWRT
jgi:hypothetical protein